MYHATELDRKEGIETNGLYARPTEAALRIFGGAGVWLFASLDDAKAFAALNYNQYDGYVIFEVDTDGLVVIDDPEYDTGTSYICTEDIPADRLAVTVEVSASDDDN